jgi:RNA methyltransferase, TrmH family
LYPIHANATLALVPTLRDRLDCGANGHKLMITSRDNKWLKIFRAGLRGKGPEPLPPGARGGETRAEDLLAVEGPKLVRDALEAGLEAEALLVSESGECEVEPILASAAKSEAGISRSRIFRTTDKLFDGVSGTEAPQGVAALFRQRIWGIEDLLRGPAPAREASALVVVLAGVQDPGNVGTIVRSAEAFGATGVAATRGTADPWSPKAIRASAGSALRLPILRGMAVPVLLAQLRISRVRVYAASSHAANGPRSNRPEPQADLAESCAIFVGNEGAGLPVEVEHTADAVLTIQTTGVESLNAAVAASIALYEAARQRREAADRITAGPSGGRP